MKDYDGFFRFWLGCALFLLGLLMVWNFAGDGEVEADRLAQAIGFIFIGAGVRIERKGIPFAPELNCVA
jgi:hypothetical protein